MHPKKNGLNEDEIKLLLRRCKHENQKTFTKTLKDFEKGRGRYCITGEEGVEIFRGCFCIFDKGGKKENPIIQYNALRLAKYAVDSPHALGKGYKKPWELYLKTIFHKDGRVRMAGIHLLDRYYFGLSFDLTPTFMWQGKMKKTDLAKTEEVGSFIVEKYLYLQNSEEDYLNKHENDLCEEDCPDFIGTMPWASDTKDKFLKSIRMGLETFSSRGPLEKLMCNHEYHQKFSSEFEDTIIFQRYEKN